MQTEENARSWVPAVDLQTPGFGWDLTSVSSRVPEPCEVEICGPHLGNADSRIGRTPVHRAVGETLDGTEEPVPPRSSGADGDGREQSSKKLPLQVTALGWGCRRKGKLGVEVMAGPGLPWQSAGEPFLRSTMRAECQLGPV